MKLIPFDLEKALAGAEVRTRDGREVTDIAFFSYRAWPVSGTIFGGSSYRFTQSGHYYTAESESRHDLFLTEPSPKPHETIWTAGTRWTENKFARKEGV